MPDRKDGGDRRRDTVFISNKEWCFQCNNSYNDCGHGDDNADDDYDDDKTREL